MFYFLGYLLFIVIFAIVAPTVHTHTWIKIAFFALATIASAAYMVVDRRSRHLH